MLEQQEIQAIQALLNRVDIKGGEAGIVAQIQFKLKRMLEEPKEEDKKLDEKIDETEKKKV